MSLAIVRFKEKPTLTTKRCPYILNNMWVICNFSMSIESGLIGKLVYFPFNDVPFLKIMILLDEQHIWKVGEVSRKM